MDRIDHPTAVDIGGGRRGFRSKDTAAGLPGTVATAAHLNATQEEMMAIIEGSGIAPSGSDLGQLAKAIRSRRMNIPTLEGTTNALTLTFDPALGSLAEIAGADIIIKPNFTNTGPVTVDGLPLTYRDGRPLYASELIVDQYVVIRLNPTATGWLLGSAPLKLGTTSLRDQRINLDLVQISSIAPDNPAAATTGTIIGEVTLPAGHISLIIEPIYYAAGGTTETTLYISNFINDGSGWVNAEFNVQYKYQTIPQIISRPALRTLDPTKSHTIRTVGWKNAATGTATPPSGNLQVQGFKV